MVRADTLILIAESPAAHGVFDDPVETTRTVFCTEKSISQTETYQAQAVGLNPELKLILAHAFEYGGEKLCQYKGIRYKILRTYHNEGDQMELTVQRVDGNAEVTVSV